MGSVDSFSEGITGALGMGNDCQMWVSQNIGFLVGFLKWWYLILDIQIIHRWIVECGFPKMVVPQIDDIDGL